MKFRAHDTFFIRKGWISKGMRHVDRKPNVFIDKQEKPMDVLGIGANMVKALRYWLQALGLTEEPTKGKRNQTFTKFGELVFKHDKYIEELGTLYLLHYKLASNKELATSWYYFFNEFSLSDFSREDFVTQITNYIKMEDEGSAVALRSLEDDFNCIINSYVPRYKTMPGKVSAENNIDCPLGEMGFIDIIKKEKNSMIYKKSIPSSSTFNPWVILAVIQDYVKNNPEKESYKKVGSEKYVYEIGLNKLLTAPNNIGRIFNLDSIVMLDVLHAVENIGELKIVRTAGLDVVRLSRQYTFEECVNRYYHNIESLD